MSKFCLWSRPLSSKEYDNLIDIFNATDLARFILIHQLWSTHVRSVDTAFIMSL